MKEQTTELKRVLEKSDYWRRSAATTGGPAAHREWNYFCVFADEGTLIVNLSLMDRISLPMNSLDKREQARVAVLVRNSAGRWLGAVDQYAPDTVSIRAGRIDSWFGPNSLELIDGSYRLRICMTEAGVEADLVLKPVAQPALTRSVPLGKTEPMRWLVVPRLQATGKVRFGEQLHYIRHSPAYHDHNWGRFSWGGDFGWEWGISLNAGGKVDWSVIYYRITDRGRHHVLSQGLLLWRNHAHSRTFQDSELDVRSFGLLRSKRLLHLPGITALAIPGTAADIPRRIEIRARSGGDTLEVALDLNDRAQIGVPNDHDSGFTCISETHGRSRIQGMIRGETIAFESLAVVEFNRAA
jgi:hypothetical protein